MQLQTHNSNNSSKNNKASKHDWWMGLGPVCLFAHSPIAPIHPSRPSVRRARLPCTNYWPNFHANTAQKWVQEQTIAGAIVGWAEWAGVGGPGATAMHNWVNLTCSCRSNSWRLRRVAIFGSRARVARQKSNGMGEWATGRMNVNVQNLYCDICNDFSRWAAAGQTNKLQAMQ